MLSIVIPIYNEAQALPKFLTALIKAVENDFPSFSELVEIICVDNGSTDRSAEIIKASQANYIYEPKRGYGHAIKAGLRYANGDYICLIDADMTYDPKDIKRLYEVAKQGKFALANRYGYLTDNIPKLNFWLGHPILRFFLRRKGIKTREVSAGFCCFPNILRLFSEGMEFSSELLVKASRNMPVEEVPIWFHERVGKSKLNRVKDLIRHLKYLCGKNAT